MKRAIRAIGGSIIFAINCEVILLLVIAAGFLNFEYGLLSSLYFTNEISRHFYMTGRTDWQSRPDCVNFSYDLIYVPKLGSCIFESKDFKTILNFSLLGREPAPPIQSIGNNSPVLVLGDSFAMGWGVNDVETFSNRLSIALRPPIYNLGVSSYGTARELRAAIKHPLFERADTVIIQYCNNDLEENKIFDQQSSSDKLRLYKSLFVNTHIPFTRALWNRFKFVVVFHLVSFKALVRPIYKAAIGRKRFEFSFVEHYDAFINQLVQFPQFKSKQIIVFYVNQNGFTFHDFPSGIDTRLPNVRFVSIPFSQEDFFDLDDHLNAKGHQKISDSLSRLVAGREHLASQGNE